jgi:bifunctional UDP-N-acetylglucosamine pyrophosphorylase/glucosamine-1-phosphate N-acetyltransferase
MAGAPRVVILAAGQGTRMRSAMPKVLHPLGGRPMLSYAVALAREISPEPPIVVINPAQLDVRAAVDGAAQCVQQDEPRGTGDAVRSVPEQLRTHGPVVVLGADVPLLNAETVRRLVDRHRESDAAVTLLTVNPSDASGLGRVYRDANGRVARIVEERDLPAGTPPLEANAGVYVFSGERLWPALDRVSNNNAQGEYYLTDVIELLAPDVQAVSVDDSTEVLGINDRRQLAQAEAVVRRRTLDRLMLAGVTIEDPATAYIDADVEVGADSVVRAMTCIRGATRIGRDADIGPGARLRDVQAGDSVRIGASDLDECRLGDGVWIGAHCRVRPNTTLGSGVQLGTHAEVKNSNVGPGTHLNHFSCVLDSDVGRDVNVGAGTVTCNYDGSAKHRTRIGDEVFIGSNSTLVAPLNLGDRCYIAAGSVITEDVPAGALAVGRARQRNIERWVERRRGLRSNG